MAAIPARELPTFTDSEFDEILETCRQFLLKIATADLPSQLTAKGGASDLVQQTLAAAVRNRQQFRGTTVDELRAWLRGILLNELALFRRKYLATHGRDVSRELRLEAIEASLLPNVESPIANLVQDERDRALSEAMAQLPDDQRQAVVLRMEFGLGFREIGDRLGRSEEAARKLFNRSLDRLRGLLATSA